MALWPTHPARIGPEPKIMWDKWVMEPVAAPNCPNCLMRCQLDEVGYFCEACGISILTGELEL